MSEPTGKHRAYALRGAGPTLGAGVLLALCTARCTFPEYDSIDAVAGTAGASPQGSNGGAGGTGPSGGGGTGATAGAALAGGGTQAGAGAGGALDCPGEQWPALLCPDDCLERYPDTCYDGSMTDVALGVACGAGCEACTNEECASPGDCLSGVCLTQDGLSFCHAPLILRMRSDENNFAVSLVAWSLTLTSAEPTGGKNFAVQDLELRYYFDRNGVIEPIIVRATQANLRLVGGESHDLPATTWTVERVEEGPDIAYNAYVSVAFNDSAQLFPGDQLTVYQQMLTGDTAKSLFDQRANYSFANLQDAPWLGVSVHYQGQLLWGLEPRPSNPRACFVRAVDLAGPASTVDGRPWQGAAEAGVVSGGTSVSQAGAWSPPPASGVGSMLASAERLDAGQELSLPTENGSYLVYVYATSSTTEDVASVLSVQGATYANGTKFRAQSTEAGFTWSRLGPFRVDVSTGELTLAVSSGAVNFAGVELWYPE